MSAERGADVEIRAADGQRLAATLFRPDEPARGAVLVAPATGIRRRFYRAFASHLASRGFAAITFDNRGIGDSLDGPVSAHDATLVAWGRLDLPAVLDRLADEVPGAPLHLLGHSAGGQLVGLMPNATRLRSLVCVACSSGSLRNMRPLYRAKAAFFLRVLLPATSRVLGAGRSDWVGMGEPLPRGVAAEWGRWCSGRGYVEVALREDPSLADHQYGALAVPSLWLHATDDDIANLANVRDMLRVYPRLDAEVRTLEPKALGKAGIGHMGFFRDRELWPLAVDWLAARGGPRPA